MTVPESIRRFGLPTSTRQHDQRLRGTHLRDGGRHARKTAEEFDVTLNFSPESLTVVDELITNMYFIEADLDSVMTSFGIYAGEVVRRNLGGRWIEDEQFGLHLRGVGEENVMSQPLKWLRDRFENGPSDPVAAKYTAVLEHLQGGTKIPQGRVSYVRRPAVAGGDQPELDEALLQAPAIVFFLIASADGDVEIQEWERFLQKMSDYHADQSELFEQAVVGMNPRLNQYFAFISSPDFNADKSLARIREVLDTKYEAPTAANFKQALVKLAKEIAAAASGFLGFGEKVSAEEIQAMTKISEALGLEAEE
ncbi:MAG: tellurite resistance protein [Limisphaerales bacterium]